ncbi:MAG TPA: 4-hydroxy-3-methylbut-2-enyl diphosphate reductase [Bacteroidales bacterium]|nr:4-hydroxy-3-methylbut-2-enyl diphosphate reductase [Bacteroidales bacterium]
MKVVIDPDSGFCFGVNRAIQTAENELKAGKPVYCLGEMVHNQVQMEQLKSKGLRIITHADLHNVKGETVLIRAHGEPPETFRLAKELGITLINATCPIVSKLQEKIFKSYSSDASAEVQIMIYGKPGHAEVVGLSGNAGNKAIVVSGEDDFSLIDFSKPIHLYSQTTMDGEGYLKIAGAIQQQMHARGNTDLVIQKSVCKQVSGRAPALRAFAAQHDVIIFVSGKNSANGKYLFGICREVNEKSYLVGNTADIDSNWFSGAKSAGISGATSTPGWLIEEVAGFIRQI